MQHRIAALWLITDVRATISDARLMVVNILLLQYTIFSATYSSVANSGSIFLLIAAILPVSKIVAIYLCYVKSIRKISP